MVFAKAFFDLQLLFAEKVRALSGLPLDRVLLEYTNLFVRFGLGREFDAGHETWRAYAMRSTIGSDVPLLLAGTRDLGAFRSA